MAYTLACKDVGGDRPSQFTTESQDELMEHVSLHARMAHPDVKLDEQTVEQVKQQVKSA